MRNIIILISTLIILVFSTSVAADDIMIHDAWVHSAPPNVKVLAAYLTVMNNSDEARALVKVTSGMFSKVEMHKTEMHGDMMKMIPQEKVIVPAGGSLLLKPGGYHLMLIKPSSVPKKGDEVDLELIFDNGHNIKINAPVREAKDGSMMKEHQHH